MNNTGTEPLTRLERERAAFRYSQALEGDDWATLIAILGQAEVDAPLARMIDEINAAQAIELTLGLHEQDAQTIRDLMVTYLPSGKVELVDPPMLTVGSIAAAMREKVERHGQGGPNALSILHRLQASNAPLPDSLSQHAVRLLFEHLGIAVNESFRKVFRDTAITLSMGRTQHLHQLAAARRQQPWRSGAGDEHAK